MKPGVLTVRGRMFAVAGAAGMVGGFLLGFQDVTRVGVLVAALPALAHLLARRAYPQIAVVRTVVPPRLMAGESGRVRVDLTNVGTRRTPLYLAEERLGYALGDRPRLVLTPMEEGGQRRLTYPIRSLARGRHKLGPLSLRARDPFGLAHVQLVLTSTHDVIVLPQVEPLVGFPRGNGIGNEGEVPFMIALQGEDDVTVRQFRDGDDLRHVHWPATAHRGQLMVRQEDRPARRRGVLFLDPRAHAHAGTGASSSFEWAVSMLASAAEHLGSNGYAVHVVCAAEPGGKHGAVAEDDTLGRLAVTEPNDLQDALPTLVKEAHAISAGGAVVVAVIADEDPEAVRQVAQLREPGGAGLAFVLDTQTFASGRGQERPTAETVEMLRSAGWRVVRVTAGVDVGSAWLQGTTFGGLGGESRVAS